jgi:hypothetical protein
MKDGGSALQSSASALTHTKKKKKKTFVAQNSLQMPGLGTCFNNKKK